MVFGREEEVQLGFANFKEKENPFTQVAYPAVFGSSTTDNPPPPPANTPENVAAAAGDRSGSFFSIGLPAYSLPASAAAAPPVVDIQPRLLFGIHPPNSTSAFGRPSSRNGDQPCVTNPTTAGAALFSSQSSTCSFQQPSNSIPSNTILSVPAPSLFKSPQSGGQHWRDLPPLGAFGPSISSSYDVSQTGGQHSSGWSPFSSGISSSHAASQLNGQHSSGGFSLTVSSSPVVSQFGGQHSSGASLFTHSISSIPTVSQSGGQHSSGWSPFSSSISSLPTVSQTGGQHSSGLFPFPSVVSSSPALSVSDGQHSRGTLQFPPAISGSSDGQHSSGWSPFSSGSSRYPFGVTLPSSKSPFSVHPPSSDSSVTTSPFQTTLPFSGLVVPTVDSRLRGSTISSTGPSTKSLFQENNTSSNCASVFAPFTRSNARVQGTRICSYAPTPADEFVFNDLGRLSSISAMPMYKEKSHEELRLEDYQIRHIPTSSSSSISTIPCFSFLNKSSTDSLPLGPSVSTTRTPHIPISSLPHHHPVISIPLSIEIKHLGDLLCSTQITIPVQSSGTVPASNYATVTEAIVTSIPEPVSTGGFRWPADNRQTPAEPGGTEATNTLPTTVPHGISGLFVKPVPPEATVTNPKTVPYGISGLPISENCESRPPVEKYKPDDEDYVKIWKFFDVMAMIPKLKCPGYYTVPSMDDLIKNELKKPGSCSQVKDFVIGKHGYGSIKFSGETDVRNLDLESMIQFNTREVIFCMDQKTKPPIGQGLNKAAEITLNVDCMDKDTGKRYIDGPIVDKYKELLVKKTMEQGAEFVSFDAAKGEWKFKVQHF